jgi:hypothetical protein
MLKGTVPSDFSPLVFFFRQLLLAPVDKPSNDFDFFRKFVETFDFSSASSYWCINGVNDTGNACIAGVIGTGEVGDIYCPVSMTPVMHDVTGVNDTSNMLRRCH